MPALAGQGIRSVAWTSFEPAAPAALGTFFRDAVLPVLTPLAIDMSRPFPLLSSLSLNLALLLEPAPGETEPPPGDRAGAAGPHAPGAARRAPTASRFVLLEDVIRRTCAQLFPGQPILESAVIRLARDAELELDDEGGRTQLELVERELRRRRRSDVVRLEVEADASRRAASRCCASSSTSAPDDVYAVPGPLDLRVLMGLIDLPGLRRAARSAAAAGRRARRAQHTDLFAVLDERDVLLHHPYDAYDPVVALLAQAADDPGRPGDQADALPHERRIADHREPAARRRAATSR